MLDAFTTTGTSPPKNYRVREVRFSVVRASAPAPATLSSPAAVADLIRALGGGRRPGRCARALPRPDAQRAEPARRVPSRGDWLAVSEPGAPA